MRCESFIIGFQKRFFTLGGILPFRLGAPMPGLGAVPAACDMPMLGWDIPGLVSTASAASADLPAARITAPEPRRHGGATLRSVVAEVDHRPARQQRRQHKHQSAHVCFPKTVQAARASNEDWRISHRAALAATVRVSNKDDGTPPSIWYLQPRTTRPPALCQTYQTL